MADKKSERRGIGTFKLVLIVLILLLIPTTMEQLAANPDTVRNVGRVCVGIALLFFFYGLLSKALRFVGLVLLVLIAARVLANEGVVEVPKLRGKIEDARNEGR
jgi:O-antigen ligase